MPRCPAPVANTTSGCIVRAQDVVRRAVSGQAREVSATRPQRFFFVHLQKTAGTSLFIRLRRHLGEDAVYPMPEYEGVDWSNTNVDMLRDVFEQRGDDIRAVVGHFPLCTVDLLGVPFTTLTVLRDPFPRTLSFLRHRREKLPDRADATLDELYSEPVTLHALIHNHMTRMLGMTAAQMTDGMATMVDHDEALLRRAEEGLERIDVVGLQERFGDFWTDVQARFGWELGDELRANATKPDDEEIDPWFDLRIRTDNELDFRLYQYAVDLVARRSQEG